jgi:hypothetical protein
LLGGDFESQTIAGRSFLCIEDWIVASGGIGEFALVKVDASSEGCRTVVISFLDFAPISGTIQYGKYFSRGGSSLLAGIE